MTPSATPRAGIGAPPTQPRLVFAWGALAYALAYLAWSGSGSGSAQVRALAGESVFLPLGLAAVFLYLQAARRPQPCANTRLALRFLGAAAATYVAGKVVAVVQLLVGGRVPTGSVADLLFLATYPLNLAALLLLPGSPSGSGRWKALCDAGMVIAGAGVALWYFVLRAAAIGATDPRAVPLALVYPLADLLLLVGLVSILLHEPEGGNRIAVRWLAVATVLLVAADLSFNLLVARTGQRSSLTTDGWFLAFHVAQVVAAERFWQGALAPAQASARQRLAATRLRSLLPFTAAGATYLLLLVVALREWVAPLSGLAIGAIAVSLFLGARQLLAFRRDAVILAEQAVRASEARFRSLVQHSSDLIFQLDAEGRITFASSSVGRVIGHAPDALTGTHLSALASAEDLPRVISFVDTMRQLPGLSPAVEWRLRRPDGDIVQVEVVGTNLLDDDTVQGIVLNARDVGERRALLDQLAHQAFHDPLTGLANRALFYDRVSHALALARRHGRTVMLLFLDLDDFKQVNDTLGHGEGDRLLTMIAARLRACARVTDTVARLGGDEFALLIEDDRVDEGGLRLVARIREQMSFPFSLAGADVQISASIGSASGHDGEVDDMLRQADLAMYAAKRTEKGTHRAYDPSLRDDSRLTNGTG